MSFEANLMDDPRFIKPEPIELKNLDNFNEAKLQDIIAKDPAILGLGDDLYVKSREKTLPGSGRLDLLLSDSDEGRYEVELQLGVTDETHIIRCLEYWDIEKKRYPQYEHTAVLVAEDINSRFLNVISMFNGSVPLIALKLAAFRLKDQEKIILSFVKVLDKVIREDDPVEETIANRTYWVDRSSEDLVSMVDGTVSLSFRKILKEISPELDIKYNTQYIGIQENGISNVFASFIPNKKGYVRVAVRLRNDDALENWKNDLYKVGLTANSKNGWLDFQLKTKQELENYQDPMTKMLKMAYDMT